MYWCQKTSRSINGSINKIVVPLKFLKDNPSLKDKIQPVRAELGLLMLHWGGREFLNMI